MNPPRIFDPIITTLSDYYQLPKCLPPLDADPDSNGKPSDHMMVEMEPVSINLEATDVFAIMGLRLAQRETARISMNVELISICVEMVGARIL